MIYTIIWLRGLDDGQGLVTVEYVTAESRADAVSWIHDNRLLSCEGRILATLRGHINISLTEWRHVA